MKDVGNCQTHKKALIKEITGNKLLLFYFNRLQTRLDRHEKDVGLRPQIYKDSEQKLVEGPFYIYTSLKIDHKTFHWKTFLIFHP